MCAARVMEKRELTTLLRELRGRLDEMVADTVAVRHRLHQVPEPANMEKDTSVLVREQMVEAGLDTVSTVGGTGLVGTLDSCRPGPTVVLRADMDALPVEEATGVPYTSRRPGYSHCCGHDGHMAILLGVARMLCRMRDALSGTVRFLFQPAEESGQGARRMMEAGALGTAPVAAVLGLHASPGLPVGTVGCRAGSVTAAIDSFTIAVNGSGGHSARPHSARNPLEGIARLIQDLPALSNAERVITVCTVKAGASRNVIPDTATLGGTCRSVSPQVRKQAVQDLSESALRLCEEVDLHAQVTIDEGCPPVVTNAELFRDFCVVARALEPHVQLAILDKPSMGSEDFAYYLEKAPGLLFRLGMGAAWPDLHTASFDFNDAAIETGISMLAGMTLRLCRSEACG